MRRIRMAGLCLVALFALGAVASAGASAAEPSWYECAKVKKTGGFDNSTCTEANSEGKGAYELQPGVAKGKAFKASGGAVIVEVVDPPRTSLNVDCTSFKESGTAAVPNRETGVTIDFAGCKLFNRSGPPCTTAGAKTGEIHTNALAGELGYIQKAGPVVGVDLANEEAPGSGVIAEFNCFAYFNDRWIGSVIGAVGGNVNAINKKTSVTYSTGNYLGEPEEGYVPITNVPSFEGEAFDYLKSQYQTEEAEFTWQPPDGLPSGLKGVLSISGEALEVKA